ncbi:MAG: hypothetical protein A3E82_07260 [Gammaproteobacteria bacterium RIFCSPHIGHO2_12_FULL_38_11]|nr:MAG: hypothetical protein A3E82_07260 [Gammaproteobacteria bacterium RIFCSPHIGHO2_12_FULL_38_11]
MPSQQGLESVTQWVAFSQGGFNIAFVSEEALSSEVSGLSGYSGKVVLKLRYKPEEPTEEPSRNSRLFEQLNPSFPAKTLHINPKKFRYRFAEGVSLENGAQEFLEKITTLKDADQQLDDDDEILVWISPFFTKSETKITDEELSQKIIQMYKDNRLMPDGCDPDNFNKQENLICIDPGFALLRQSMSPGSPTSQKAWESLNKPELKAQYNHYWEMCGEDYPKAANTVRALLLIDSMPAEQQQSLLTAIQLNDNNALLEKLSLRYQLFGTDTNDTNSFVIRLMQTRDSQTMIFSSSLFASQAVSMITFPNKNQARPLLHSFIDRLNAMELRARLPYAQAYDLGSLYKRGCEHALINFDEAERSIILQCCKNILERISQLNIALNFPDAFSFFRFDGIIEFDSAFTLGNAIFLPTKKLLNRPLIDVERTIAHEIFHVLSRNNPQIVDSCYAVLGFSRTSEADQQIISRKLEILSKDGALMTNPDVDLPLNHKIRVMHEGRPTDIIPLVYLKAIKSEYPLTPTPNSLPFCFSLLKLDDSDELTMLSVIDIEGFYENIGRNTSYILHPEEITADHFKILISPKGEEEIPNPELIHALLTHLKPQQADTTATRRERNGSLM